MMASAPGIAHDLRPWLRSGDAGEHLARRPPWRAAWPPSRRRRSHRAPARFRRLRGARARAARTRRCRRPRRRGRASTNDMRIGQPVAVRRFDRANSRIAAVFGHRQHAVADLDRVTPAPTAATTPGRPLAGNERQRRRELIFAADHQKIDEIDGAGMHLDQHLAGLRRRLRHLADMAFSIGPNCSTTTARMSFPQIAAKRGIGFGRRHVALAAPCQRTGCGAQAALGSTASARSRFRILPLALSGISSSGQEIFRHVVFRQARRIEMLEQLVGRRCSGPCAEHHREADLLAQPLVGVPEWPRRARTRRWRMASASMRAGLMLWPPRMMTSFLRPGDAQIAVLVDPAEIAGHEPAVSH